MLIFLTIYSNKPIVIIFQEINLFLNQEIDFKSIKLKRALKKIIKELYSNVLIKNEYFKFYLTKNGNTKVIKVKTEKE